MGGPTRKPVEKCHKRIYIRPFSETATEPMRKVGRRDYEHEDGNSEGGRRKATYISKVMGIRGKRRREVECYNAMQ